MPLLQHGVRRRSHSLFPPARAHAEKRVGPTDDGSLRAEETGETPRADLGPDECFASGHQLYAPELARGIPDGEKCLSTSGARGRSKWAVFAVAGLRSPWSFGAYLWSQATPHTPEEPQGLNTISLWL